MWSPFGEENQEHIAKWAGVHFREILPRVCRRVEAGRTCGCWNHSRNYNSEAGRGLALEISGRLIENVQVRDHKPTPCTVLWKLILALRVRSIREQKANWVRCQWAQSGQRELMGRQDNWQGT